MTHPTRRALLDLLADDEELSSAEAVERLPDEQPRPRVVYHLRVLQEFGLVARVDGKWTRT